MLSNFYKVPLFLITLSQLIFPWPLQFLFSLTFILLRRLPRLLVPSPKTREPFTSAVRTPYLPPALFSVHPSQAIIASSSMVLSAVRIPIQWCPPSLQHSEKNRRRAMPCRSSLLLLLLLGSLFRPSTAVYILPGTNHAIISGGAPSLDSVRQQHLIDTVIQVSTTSNDEPYFALPIEGASPPESLPTQPYCFVADTDSFPFVLDSGANRFIVNDPTLFSSFKPKLGLVKGIGGSPVPLTGTGTIRLPLKSDSGTIDTVTIDDAVYIPTSPFNLVPPQLLIRHLNKSQYDCDLATHNDKEYVFQYRKAGTDVSTKRKLTVPIGNNDLFTVRSNEGYTAFFRKATYYAPEWCVFVGNSHVIPDDQDDGDGGDRAPTRPIEETRELLRQTSEKPREDANVIPFLDQDFEPIRNTPQDMPFNLQDSDKFVDDAAVNLIRQKQQRLATIHEQLGHLSFSRLRLLAKARLIPHDLASVDPPTCPGCAYGKAHRKPWRHKGTNRRPIKPATSPGQVVSIDQLISPTEGFVPTHRGTPTTLRYQGATVFVDHFSDFTYVHLMTKMDGESTVEAKLAFERVASSHGVNVLHYHADNGLFDSKVFKESVTKGNQTLSFCGVNAHHQNGRAEARIKDITTNARTALLHAAHRWPKAIHASLWPSALKNYTNIRNALPTDFSPAEKQGRNILSARYERSPLSKFSRTEIEPNLDHFHPFGSPVYVLENNLQAHHAHNKWSDRSRVGIFLCHSPSHASSVPLVLNTQTGLVSPQFHCIYDNQFDTCRRDAKFISQWQFKAKLQGRPKPSVIERSDMLPTVDPSIAGSPSLPLPSLVTIPPRLVTPWDLPAPTLDVPMPVPPPQVAQNDHTLANNDNNNATSLDEAQDNSVAPLPEPPHTTTRSGRSIRRPARFVQNVVLAAAYLVTYSPQPIDDRLLQLLQPDIESYSEPHPFALLTEQISVFLGSDPDTMYLEEAMNQPDKPQFVQAMYKELQDHVNRRHWVVVPLKSVPANKKPLPMVWSMKRKRNPIGEITKWKARLCAGGHKSIQFVDYWSTYSPVVSWSTVRLLIIIAIINDWHMRSIDFVLAYPQAAVKTDIYMMPPKVPPGFVIPDLPTMSQRVSSVYKLLQNLYGLKDAGKTWYDHLRKGLLARGWRQSEIDGCLFTKEGIILVVYVDDAILISPFKTKINLEIESLKREYDLTDEGELQDYLGIRFDRRDDGSLKLTQPRMIERVLEIVGLSKDGERVKLHDTPASEHQMLDNNPDGAVRSQVWNYRSAVGCLSYIQAMIRPDITMAVQQCARFCNNPQRDHEEAVKRICRYLLKTKDEGLILRPDKSRGLECYVDADWAGSWNDRSSHDPLSSHSRTGFVVLYAGCPIIWGSKMQQLIALSTTEAEYIALSTALRDVIHVIHLLEELQSHQFNIHHPTPKITCRTFEDNKSCIEIATNHKTRARTKHLSVRLHHFRSHVVNKTITIEHVSTKNQIADMFTKPLPRDQFENLRNRLMCWPSSSSRGSVKLLMNTLHPTTRLADSMSSPRGCRV
jgi:hypothetical protein